MDKRKLNNNAKPPKTSRRGNNKNKSQQVGSSTETRNLISQLDSFNSSIKNSVLQKMTKLEKENADLRANVNDTMKRLDQFQLKSKKVHVEQNLVDWEKEYLRMENKKLRGILSKLNADPKDFATKELNFNGKIFQVFENGYTFLIYVIVQHFDKK